mmetsp:Transcript_21863/g.86801  ORF Transcript_21863/g.86801 Transcript_21863/m.86801 type:complete len:379 (+) Transcript_21863:918-2054(+)
MMLTIASSDRNGSPDADTVSDGPSRPRFWSPWLAKVSDGRAGPPLGAGGRRCRAADATSLALFPLARDASGLCLGRGAGCRLLSGGRRRAGCGPPEEADDEPPLLVVTPGVTAAVLGAVVVVGALPEARRVKADPEAASELAPSLSWRSTPCVARTATSRALATDMRVAGSKSSNPRRIRTSQPSRKMRPREPESRSPRSHDASPVPKRCVVRRATAERSSKSPFAQSASAPSGLSVAPVKSIATSTPTDQASMASKARRLDRMIIAPAPVVSGGLNGHVSGTVNGRFVATSLGPAPAESTLSPTSLGSSVARDGDCGSSPTRTESALSERCGRPRWCKYATASRRSTTSRRRCASIALSSCAAAASSAAQSHAESAA